MRSVVAGWVGPGPPRDNFKFRDASSEPESTSVGDCNSIISNLNFTESAASIAESTNNPSPPWTGCDAAGLSAAPAFCDTTVSLSYY